VTFLRRTCNFVKSDILLPQIFFLKTGYNSEVKRFKNSSLLSITVSSHSPAILWWLSGRCKGSEMESVVGESKKVSSYIVRGRRGRDRVAINLLGKVNELL
jgi:hypothetical protein